MTKAEDKALRDLAEKWLKCDMVEYATIGFSAWYPPGPIHGCSEELSLLINTFQVEGEGEPDIDESKVIHVEPDMISEARSTSRGHRTHNPLFDPVKKMLMEAYKRDFGWVDEDTFSNRFVCTVCQFVCKETK